VRTQHHVAALATIFTALLGQGCGESSTAPDTDFPVSVQPMSARVSQVGDSIRFEAFAVSASGSRESVQPVWSSSNTEVVHIDSQGWATALELGAAVIQAEHQGEVGSAFLLVTTDVSPPMLRSVVAAQTRVSLSSGPITVPITAEFVDEGSGVGSALATFDGPLGGGITGLVTFSLASEEVTSDSAVVSTYEGSLNIPGTIGVGTWTLSELRADDRSGNSSRWGEADLDRLGSSVVIIASTGG